MSSFFGRDDETDNDLLWGLLRVTVMTLMASAICLPMLCFFLYLRSRQQRTEPDPLFGLPMREDILHQHDPRVALDSTTKLAAFSMVRSCSFINACMVYM